MHSFSVNFDYEQRANIDVSWTRDTNRTLTFDETRALLIGLTLSPPTVAADRHEDHLLFTLIPLALLSRCPWRYRMGSSSSCCEAEHTGESVATIEARNLGSGSGVISVRRYFLARVVKDLALSQNWTKLKRCVKG